jgi:menaquinone-dependent protoporphyrinogen oxidase
MKVLVAYASRYGSTKGIAEFIAERLRQKGIEADAKDVGNTGELGAYDAFVVGSAVFMGHWMNEAKQFLRKNRAVLLKHPIWLFSSGPTGSKPTDDKGRNLLEVSGPTELEELKEMCNPRDHHVFFGALFPERLTGSTGFFYRMAQRSKSARESMSENEGDFRDWKAIEAWTDTIAGGLTPLKLFSKAGP